MSIFKKRKKHTSTQREIVIKLREDYKTILLIIDKAENITHNQLHKLFINAEFSFLTNRTEKVDNSTGNNYTLHKKDFKFAKLKNERLSDLLNQEFDLVIDLSEQSKSLKYFTERSVSSLKIGCYNTSKNYLYDILVEKKNLIKDCLVQIKRQLDLLTNK